MRFGGSVDENMLECVVCFYGHSFRGRTGFGQLPKEQIWNHIDTAGGKERLDARHGLENVFNTGIFDSIEQSWQTKGCDNGKLKVCAMKCGAEFDPFGAQFK